MKGHANGLEEEYRIALQDYLANPDEALLERAYGIGRQALTDGCGVLDMATMHSRALVAVAARSGAMNGSKGPADGPERFFVEALSPFEIAHRGFRDANDVLHRLNGMLEDQAKRIAAALHGEAAQLLASVHLALADVATRLPGDRAGEILAVRRLLDQIEDRIRRVSHELRPTILDDLGLVPAIEFLADGVSQRWGIPVTVQASVERGLPPTIETALYRAAQEGLNNVAKHAQATQAEIKLHQSPRAITCSVVDDGKGFDLTTLSARDGRRGLGLVEIRERMAALGGTLRVGSSVDLGTEFTVEIPLEAPAWA